MRPIEYFVAGTTTVSRTINLKNDFKVVKKIIVVVSSSIVYSHQNTF